MTDQHVSASYTLFDVTTRAIVHGYQAAAVQRMLDFDYVAARRTPSVACIINPAREGQQLAFWGAEPIALPMYRDLATAVSAHPDTSVLINFASARSAAAITMDALGHPQLSVIAIIAEGIPERRAREIAVRARAQGVTIIGPATVGGIKAGAFKIGNAAGTIDNIVQAKLHRPGHVAYVSRSGGMSNELNNIIARNSDGVFEGIAIGGDRFAGSTFLDHLLRWQADPAVAMMVMLGEVGGTLELAVAEALRQGKITKPVVAWCIGTSAGLLGSGAQFGHAGARADGNAETARAKNAALAAAGARVPTSFEQFDRLIKATFDELVAAGEVVPAADTPSRPLPMDYPSAVRAGLVRRVPQFVSTIADDRGEEISYGGVPISEIVQSDMGVGGVIGLLWFKRRLPDWACRFIELAIEITADHGPAVSGAHNTIVAARAGKDLVSAVASGMLTIGPRFGGAVEGAALAFGTALREGQPAEAFVHMMRERNENIPGIGHLIKSVDNPDARVVMLTRYAREHFRSLRHLDYALAVEGLTTAKRGNLILNVDGCLGVLFLDLLESTGQFTAGEVSEIMHLGALNGLFVLGRTIGLIGHFMDQRRLEAPLYRHPWDDILYASNEGGQHRE
jgi:ATP citrate (pro-S)-lyase